MRIAQGEADGVAIMQFPLFRGRGRKKSADVLASQLEGPLVVLTAADLAARGLLPGGVVPIRVLVDVVRRGRPRCRSQYCDSRSNVAGGSA